MAEANIKLGYIVEPFAQFENTNGKPIVGGHLEVYIAGTDEKYITYQNFDFAQNPFKIPLGSDGRVVVLGDSELAYDVYAYDSFNNLVCSRLNVAAGDAGGVSNGGLKEVLHDNTLTGKGTQLSPLGVSPLTNLAVDDTMTAYSSTVEGKDSLVLGVNGDWFNEQFGSAFSGKLDTSSFYSAFVGIKGELSSKVDWSAMSSYYDKDETYNIFMPRSAIDLNNYYTKNETYSQEEILTFLDRKQDKLTFDYNENSAISAINGSALAGQGGEGSCPWISGGKEIAEAQTLTSNMLFQALSSFTFSGDHNHFISMKGGIYRFPNEWELASGIAITNYFMPQSSFSSYSATIAGDLSTLYGQDGYLNGQIDTLSGVLKSTSSTVNSNSGNWGKAYTATTANSGKWTSVYNTVHGNSGIWNNKLDTSSFTAYTAQVDESYLLIPGPGIDISSNTAQATTTIWFTGDAGDAQVNTVVRTNSASWNGKLDASALSAGEGITITNSNGKKVITNNISAGDNISFVYDSVSNNIRIDCDITGDVGHTYTGVAPIQVNNTTDQISISGESLSAGPGIDLLASGGYVVISANDQSNCHCIKFTNTLTSVNLENYSAYDKVTVVNAQEFGNDCELHWDGNTKVFPSGLYCELVRGTKNDNSDKWSFTTSGWTADFWDYN